TVEAEASSFAVRAFTVKGDLADPAQTETLFHDAASSLGGIDILILNASLQLRSPWSEIELSDFDKQVAVNWRSSLQLAQLAQGEMRQRRWGRIVTVGSVQQYVPHPNMLVYAATKAAQMNMVTNLA